jgi:protein SCO1
MMLHGMALFALLATVSSAFAHGTDHAHGTTEIIVGDELLTIPDFPVESAAGTRDGLRTLLPAEAPIIMSFTYTGCESLCDITNAVLLGVDEELASDDLGGARIVTITIDPANDTSTQLDATRRALAASDRWLWLTAGVRGTPPLLDALRFPAGNVEDHNPIFLVGRLCAGRFIRIVGLATPEDLVAHARALPPCAG